MIIYTDSRKSLHKIIEKNALRVAETSNPIENLTRIKNEIFNDSSISFFESAPTHNWEYLFLTEHANKSQFDSLDELLTQNQRIPNYSIFAAEKGSGFHGFRNRKWSTKSGNIHLTIYFEPQVNFKYLHAGLLLVAAVSVLRTIDRIPHLKNKAKTKWVNDIVINNSKVCGIITKSYSTGNKVTGALLGLGLNVLTEPDVPSDIFTTETTSLLAQIPDKTCNLQKIFNDLLNELSNSIKMLNDGMYDTLYNLYCERSAVIGRKVTIYNDREDKNKIIGSGKIERINKNLELILENSDEIIRNGRLAFDNS